MNERLEKELASRGLPLYSESLNILEKDPRSAGRNEQRDPAFVNAILDGREYLRRPAEIPFEASRAIEIKDNVLSRAYIENIIALI